MEGASTRGILSHLSELEVQARSRKKQPPQQQQQHRVKELKAKVEALMLQRDQLKAEIHTLKNLHKLRSSLDEQREDEGSEPMNEECENSDLLRLMARHIQLKDLLHAHHLIGGYDVIKTHQGKGVCVSLATAYEGVCLDTFNLEVNLKPPTRIIRHDIPSFIPVNDLAEQSGLQTNLKGFLDVLSRHLNAFAGRKQQLKLVQEQHKSVEVLESNVLCSILVLLFTVPTAETAVCCTLEYRDHTGCLPTQVSFECDDQQLPDSAELKNNCSLLLENPLHKALITLKNMGCII